jgi:hypothetical protein
MRRRTNSANSTYTNAYNTAREYPGTIAAVVIGIGVTAALLWAARRAGGWRELQDAATERARQGYDYAVEGYNRIKNRQESVTE